MSTLIKEARKYQTWELLHSMTGKSKSYCKKVVLNQRNQDTLAAQDIMQKFAELEKMLIN